MFLGLLGMFAVTGTLVTRWAAALGWVAGVAAVSIAMVGNPYAEGPSDIALTMTFCTVV